MGYCGPDDAVQLLKRAITDATGLPETREALTRFEALMPYLRAIGRKHGLDPFDYRVVEAYWIGNDLLDGFPRAEFRRILEELTRHGLPKTVAARLEERLPDAPVPHHAFHVAFVGVGQVTGRVPTTLTNIDRCRPSWGRVVQVDRGTAVAVRPRLAIEGNTLRWDDPERVVFEAEPGALPDLKTGDWVAFHWNAPALILAADQRARLEEYTVRSFEAARDALGIQGVLRLE
jgi:hypothetical protein